MTQPRFPLTGPRELISGEDDKPREGFKVFNAWVRDERGWVANYFWARDQREAEETAGDALMGTRGAWTMKVD